MGKTEAFLNLIGKTADYGPYYPVLYVGPTEKNVKKLAGDRFAKMLASTESLSRRHLKGHANKTAEKVIGGVHVTFAWAGSATELASNPAGRAYIDELDRMNADIGGEGDPVELVRARIENYAGGKLGITSTPTVDGASAVWKAWEGGTRHKWAWHCLHCGDPFIPCLELLRWPKDSTPHQAEDQARVVCPNCGAEHDNNDKFELNQGGFFIPHRLDDKGKEIAILDGDHDPNSTASFWISGLASPWRPFGKVASRLIKAYQHGSQTKIQAVVNTQGGEVFRIKGEAPEWEEVANNRGEYRPQTIPAGVQLITCGVDVQKYGLFYVIRGWGFSAESWLLEHGFLAGETEFDSVWLTLGNLIQTPIGDRAISMALIDSGYRPGDKHKRPDHVVYSFCRRFPGVAFPTKGHDTQEKPVYFRFLDYTASGATVKNGVKLYHIDTDYYKSFIHGRIKWPTDQPGAFHLHAETTDDYCQQLVAEELITKASGRHAWIMRRGYTDNHYLDCEVNAAAAAYVLGAHKLLPPETETTEINQDSQSDDDVGGIERRSLF